MMSFISKWKDKIAHYVEVRLNLIRLGIIERTSGILSYLIFVFICLFTGVAALVFIGIGIGEYFSELFNSRAAGFFAAGGLYVLLLFILLMIRKSITGAFASVFVRLLTAQDPEDEQEKQEKKEIKVD